LGSDINGEKNFKTLNIVGKIAKSYAQLR
jgi:hypothetical protein